MSRCLSLSLSLSFFPFGLGRAYLSSSHDLHEELTAPGKLSLDLSLGMGDLRYEKSGSPVMAREQDSVQIVFKQRLRVPQTDVTCDGRLSLQIRIHDLRLLPATCEEPNGLVLPSPHIHVQTHVSSPNAQQP